VGERHEQPARFFTPAARSAQINDATPRGVPNASYGLGVQIVRDDATDCVTMLQTRRIGTGLPVGPVCVPDVRSHDGHPRQRQTATDVDFNAVVRAVYPVLVDLLIIPPTQTCDPPVQPTTTTTLAATPSSSITPVAATPRFTG